MLFPTINKSYHHFVTLLSSAVYFFDMIEKQAWNKEEWNLPFHLPNNNVDNKYNKYLKKKKAQAWLILVNME